MALADHEVGNDHGQQQSLNPGYNGQRQLWAAGDQRVLQTHCNRNAPISYDPSEAASSARADAQLRHGAGATKSHCIEDSDGEVTWQGETKHTFIRTLSSE